MCRNERPHSAWTTAQLIIIILGSMVPFFGLVLLTIFLAVGDPNVANYRGVLLRRSTSLVLFIGTCAIMTGLDQVEPPVLVP